MSDRGDHDDDLWADEPAPSRPAAGDDLGDLDDDIWTDDAAPAPTSPARRPARRTRPPVEDDQDLWLDEVDEEAPPPRAPRRRPAPAPRPAPAAERYPTDDDVDDDGALRLLSSNPRVRWIQIGAAVAAVIVVVALLVSQGGKDDGPAKGGGGGDGGGQQSATSAPQFSWPAEVNGRPQAFGELKDPPGKVTAPPEPGVYLWSSFDGWHLWVVQPAGKQAAKGTITSDKSFTNVAVEDGSGGTASGDGKDTITFDLSGATEPVAGIHFDTTFFAGRLEVALDGEDLPLKLGQAMATAPEVPYAIEKKPA